MEKAIKKYSVYFVLFFLFVSHFQPVPIFPGPWAPFKTGGDHIANEDDSTY